MSTTSRNSLQSSLRWLRRIMTIILIVANFATVMLAEAAPAQADTQPSFPIRAAFYYPWFPESWDQRNINPYTNYTPSLGFYDGRSQTVIQQHIAAMQYGGIQVGIASWWGQGSQTDAKIQALLQAAAGGNFRWSIYHENESLGNPTVAQLTSDLTYLRDRYGNDPSFLRINGRFVVFVYSDASDNCGMADRWKQANTIGAYVVLKVFNGYRNCASQPDSWHQYSPAVAADYQQGYSYAVAPGFWQKGLSVRLARDLNRWNQNVKDMVASGAPWQLIATFNEWGEGTSVESAQEWASSSGYGAYLDALHNNGGQSQPTATTVSPTQTTQPTVITVPPSVTPTQIQPTATLTNTAVGPTNTPTETSTPTNTPAVPTNTSSSGGNLVLNPGFETAGASATDAANWTEGTNHTRASDKFHTGGWSLRSTFRGAGTDTRTTAPIAVSPNTTYTYSGYVWRTNSTGGVCMDMADLVGERQLCTSASGSWQFLSGTWSSGSNTSVTLRLITDGSPTGDIWFDDIALTGPSGPTATPTNTAIGPTNTPTKTSTPISPTPVVTNTPASGGNLVLDPGFETAGTSASDAANWTEGTNHTRSSDKFHTGGWSLRSAFRGSGTNTRTTVPIAINPNTTYTYSGYVWRTNSTGGACPDMNDIVGERQLCASASGSWQYLSGTWNSGSNAGVTLRLITDGSPTGDIWFDDISLAGPSGPTATPTNTTVPSGDPIIAAAGDIACDPNVPAFNGGYGTAGECRQMQVSDLLVNGGYTAVLALGDISNADGSLYVYQQSYDPTWGRVKSITHPAVGNHDYLNNPTASGYFTYFGAAAGDPTKGYYSYDIGAWHIIVLNSMCSSVGGCAVGSPQELWLKADLAAHPNMCTLAYWHHPRFSSGEQGSYIAYDPFWKALYAAGAEIVLNGHDHVYERFAPQNPNAVADPKGIQEFIVGTGGKVMNAFATTQPNSLVRHTFTFGVLKLTLHPTSYDWQFVPEAGQTWTDTGSRNCFTP